MLNFSDFVKPFKSSKNKKFSKTKMFFFSLDIEGGEFQVLKTIPWDLVDIQVLSIETHFAGW